MAAAKNSSEGDEGNGSVGPRVRTGRDARMDGRMDGRRQQHGQRERLRKGREQGRGVGGRRRRRRRKARLNSRGPTASSQQTDSKAGAPTVL